MVSEVPRAPTAVALAAFTALAACSGEGSPDSSGPPVPVPPRPNVVVVSLDTCRADALSCYGAGRENTPALDALAAESVRFTDCVPQSCLTAPSHMSLFTGMYAHRHGLTANGQARFPATTLASTLREAGWRTAAFTGHGALRAVKGLGVGFEVFESWKGPLAYPFTRDLSESVADGLAWLDARGDDGAPFFLFLHGYDPHSPYEPPEPWRSEYAGWYEGDLALGRVDSPEAFGELIAEGAIGPAELRYVADLYEAGVAGADPTVGRLLDELRARGLLERSIFVFLSDHGESLGTKGLIGHKLLLNEVLRVPFLIRFPSGTPAGTCSSPVELVDVAPTILGELGLAVPPGMQGRDLRPIVAGFADPAGEIGTDLGDRLRVSQVRNQVSLRLGPLKADFRLVDAGTSSEPSIENGRLYDLSEDPLEERNLRDDPGHREAFEALAERYRAWRGETAAEDARHRGLEEVEGAPREAPGVDEEILRALGYAGESE